MKLSEFNTADGISVLCDLSPFVFNIVSDDELMAELRNAISPEKTITHLEWIALGVAKVSKIVPIIFKKRKADVLGILAILNGIPEEKIAKQNILVTAKQLKELINDKELMDFFASCAASEESE